MGRSLTTDFVQTMRDGDPFVPIPVAALRVDSVTGFDLYIELRPGEPLVLYARRDVPFKEEARQRLEDNAVSELWVYSGDEAKFRRYLESHLGAILGDPDVEVDAKANILYMSAQGLARDILQDPRLSEGVARSKDMVEHTVNFLLNQDESLSHLIRTASFDYYAYTHSVNACVYSIALVQKMARPDDSELKAFGTGALLRDVGMASLDPSITESHGVLTPKQFEVVKSHPIIGERMLAESGALTHSALRVVRHHHEKMDGSGYPDGLRGSEIAPEVRACTIADVFDALSTNRTYRKALSTFDSLRFMRERMARQLDQDALRAFIELMGNPTIG